MKSIFLVAALFTAVNVQAQTSKSTVAPAANTSSTTSSAVAPAKKVSFTATLWSIVNVEDSRRLKGSASLDQVQTLDTAYALSSTEKAGVRIDLEYFDKSNKADGDYASGIQGNFSAGYKPGQNLRDPSLFYTQKTDSRINGSEPMTFKYMAYLPLSDSARITNQIGYLRAITDATWTQSDSRMSYGVELDARTYFRGEKVADAAYNPAQDKVTQEAVYNSRLNDGSYLRLLPNAVATFTASKSVDVYGKLGTDTRFKFNRGQGGNFYEKTEVEVGTNIKVANFVINPNITEEADVIGSGFGLGRAPQQAYNLILVGNF